MVNPKKYPSTNSKGSRWPSHSEISWPGRSRDFGGKLSFARTSARGDKGIFHTSFPLFANGFQKSKLVFSFAFNTNLALSLHFHCHTA